jgi:hypothetical protein
MSTQRVLSYAPSLVRVKLFGINIDGFSPDGVVDIERLEGAATYKKAMDGSRVVFNDRFGTYRVSVHLLQASPSNTWLHQLYKLYQKMGVEFKMPIDIQNKGNSSDRPDFTAVDVFFEDEPATRYTNGAETTTWTFLCHDGKYNRLGSIETYEIAEKLQYLFQALDLAESFGLGLQEMSDITGQMLDNLSETIFSRF